MVMREAREEAKRLEIKRERSRQYREEIKAGKRPAPPSRQPKGKRKPAEGMTVKGTPKMSAKERGERIRAGRKRAAAEKARLQIMANSGVTPAGNTPASMLDQTCKYCPNCGFGLQIVNQAIAVTQAMEKD